MNACQRVLAACEFRRPDRIPRIEKFWEFPDAWRRFGNPDDLTDVMIWAPDETPFPSRARRLKEEQGWTYERDAWGRTIRSRSDAYFVETLEVAIPPGADIEAVRFEPPASDARYPMGYASLQELNRALPAARQRHCIFAKTGGPYLRTTFLRGEQQFLMDVAGDPPLARALADKVADHLAAVGVEALRRWGLHETGVWIYDDMACNAGPIFSPKAFEQVFLSAYRRMIRRYKEAGARYVCLHSDGDVRPLLDMLIDAGLDGLNPLERRAHMEPAELRRRYPRLILAGGMCNAVTLVQGPVERIEAEAREIIDLGRDGGVIIGAHSIGRDVSMEHYAAYDRVCRTYGLFTFCCS